MGDKKKECGLEWYCQQRVKEGIRKTRKGREGKGREEKRREGKRREGKGWEGKGKEGNRRGYEDTDERWFIERFEGVK